MDKESYTCDCLNHEVGGITDEMTIYKHVFKQTKKNTVFATLSVSAVVHFYSFSTVHILKTRKKTSKYDQKIPQSHTADQDQA